MTRPGARAAKGWSTLIRAVALQAAIRHLATNEYPMHPNHSPRRVRELARLFEQYLLGEEADG